MARQDRLFDLLGILRDGQVHRAGELAAQFGVSTRTIYRDMGRLMRTGVPVQGTRGTGYRAYETIALPPLSLSAAELEALNLGMAIVGESSDPGLQAAARSLATKIDAVLPARAPPEPAAWTHAFTPFADAARGFSHMASLRSAIESRQKLRLRYRRPDGRLSLRTVRPLHMDYWGRIWTLTAWCETRGDFRRFRVDLIETATPLPELFVDEPGKRLSDYRAGQAP